MCFVQIVIKHRGSYTNRQFSDSKLKTVVREKYSYHMLMKGTGNQEAVAIKYKPNVKAPKHIK